jgi:hypothetical protein
LVKIRPWGPLAHRLDGAVDAVHVVLGADLAGDALAGEDVVDLADRDHLAAGAFSASSTVGPGGVTA